MTSGEPCVQNPIPHSSGEAVPTPVCRNWEGRREVQAELEGLGCRGHSVPLLSEPWVPLPSSSCCSPPLLWILHYIYEQLWGKMCQCIPHNMAVVSLEALRDWCGVQFTLSLPTSWPPSPGDCWLHWLQAQHQTHSSPVYVLLGQLPRFHETSVL